MNDNVFEGPVPSQKFQYHDYLWIAIEKRSKLNKYWIFAAILKLNMRGVGSPKIKTFILFTIKIPFRLLVKNKYV